jgi:hypothetical protein
MKLLDPYLSPYIKINSKWVKELNVRSGAMQLTQENVGGKL